ncbi:aldo/keto reductase [Ochrovirga pacifica]|uniref:aldo/keto reductase n=1 Tax=Ochrovirga pacifica TaxID=1042376 RepID=UPI0002559ADF|nr:aldo/keto reductase [Ochrovirga pacifica]
MKYVTLNDGNSLPILGFGTYKSTEQEGITSVKTALQNGYRLLDTASKYQNEEAVGKGIIESGISRKEIVITTKLWRTCLGYEDTKAELEKSLKKLQVDCIDLFLIHWPANAKNYNNWQQVNADTWRAMEDLQAEGKIKSIGVSNFFEQHLEALLQTAKVMPAINQIEFHPGYWQPKLMEYCNTKNIQIQAWSPFARGKVFKNETLNNIAKKHKKSVAQICLRWVLQHQVVAIPKSNTPERIKENLQVFDFKLTEEEMHLINALPLMGYSGEHPNHWPDRI